MRNWCDDPSREKQNEKPAFEKIRRKQ